MFFEGNGHVSRDAEFRFDNVDHFPAYVGRAAGNLRYGANNFGFGRVFYCQYIVQVYLVLNGGKLMKSREGPRGNFTYYVKSKGYARKAFCGNSLHGNQNILSPDTIIYLRGMDGIERRRYPRVSLTHVTVEVYSSFGELTSPEFCFIINVSENGMLFKAESKEKIFESGMLVRVTFVLPDGNIVVRSDATAIHVRVTDLSLYVGVQFKNLGIAERKLLRDYVEKSVDDPA
jgi:hypothetical protein